MLGKFAIVCKYPESLLDEFQRYLIYQNATFGFISLYRFIVLS